MSFPALVKTDSSSILQKRISLELGSGIRGLNGEITVMTLELKGDISTHRL
jgi:hypothetical protein